MYVVLIVNHNHNQLRTVSAYAITQVSLPKWVWVKVQKRQYYAKGLKNDRRLIAKAFEIAHRNNPEVDSFLLTIFEDLNREADKCITTAYDHEARTDEPYWTAWRDETIEKACPHVLVGPQVWKLWMWSYPSEYVALPCTYITLILVLLYKVRSLLALSFSSHFRYQSPIF